VVALSAVTESVTRRVQRGEAGELRGPEDVVGQEDVGETAVGHRLGLADLLAGDADGAELHLSRASCGSLWVFTCGRIRSPCASA
jgi:hypothetical protein